MRITWLILVLAACGDGDRCAPEPGPLPMGLLNDPQAMPLPDDCVSGGLAMLPGRWFVSDPGQLFYFSYPQFEGTCSTGFRRSFIAPDDDDASDDRTFHTWSDGTIYFERRGFGAETVIATAYCALADGTLAVADVRVVEGEMTTINAKATRFAAKDGPAQGLELVGELGTDSTGATMNALDVAVDGNFAYIAGFGGLDIVDVSNPSAPAAMSHHEGPFNDVVVVHGDGRTVAALAHSDLEPTQLVDVTDPRAPTLAAMIPEGAHTLFHTTRDGGSQLYLGTYADLIPKYDVAHPLAPVRLGAAMVPGEPSGVHDLFVDGDRIYANYIDKGFVAFDVSAGLDAPVMLGHIPTSYSHTSVAATLGGRRVVLHGDEGMTGTGDGAAFLRILDGDTASPSFLQELARYQSRPEVGIHNFQLVGERLYIAYYQDGVRVLDLSNPASPREIAHYNTWDPVTAPGRAFEGALGIQVVGNLIFVADILRGLIILRDPALAP